MHPLLLIGIGGGAGSILRYILSTTVQTRLENSSFPFGTLVVNILGCFTIGILSYLSDTRGVFGSEVRSFLFVGVLGGFTTFSTFSNETINLLRGGEVFAGSANAALHLFLGLGAVVLGRISAQLIWR